MNKGLKETLSEQIENKKNQIVNDLIDFSNTLNSNNKISDYHLGYLKHKKEPNFNFPIVYDLKKYNGYIIDFNYGQENVHGIIKSFINQTQHYFKKINIIDVDAIGREYMFIKNSIPHTNIYKNEESSKLLVESSIKEFEHDVENDKVFTLNIISHPLKSIKGGMIEIYDRFLRNNKGNYHFTIVVEDYKLLQSSSKLDIINNDFIVQTPSMGPDTILGINNSNLCFEFLYYVDKNIDYNNNVETKKNKEYDIDIKDGISVNIGRDNSQKKINFSLGGEKENYHALIAGASGKGKTVLLNTLIINSMKKYRTDEVNFMLFDMKGLEFKSFENKAHVIKCTSSFDEQDAFYFIEEVKNVFEKRREEMSSVGAKNFKELHNKNTTSSPRIIIIIDEFQNLFQASNKLSMQSENLLFGKILRMGRAAGVHLILCTQTLGDGVRRSVLNNIPLRICMGTIEESHSEDFLYRGNKAAYKLPKGEAIYNDSYGELINNKRFKVDFIE